MYMKMYIIIYVYHIFKHIYKHLVRDGLILHLLRRSCIVLNCLLL